VELSPYIQYNGEDITEGRKTTFNLEHSQYEHYCPDNNHPHWIDLGLPSGTKWCCCNEGASMPHEYGGYYTFEQVLSTAPTNDQIEELRSNTYHCETITLNGVKGLVVESTINGVKLFLPKAGYYNVKGDLCLEGTEGYYWSSEAGFVSSFPIAMKVGWSSFGSSGEDRKKRFSVRSVR
jgi:hypothetical protein